MGISSVVQCSLSSDMVWKSSSSSSKRSIGLGGGGVGMISTGELNERHHHTGLGGVLGALGGVTGSGWKDACSRVET